jgi:hypothetical protein
LGGKIPLKFGHNEDQPLTDGQPALGWVSRVYREGKKLLADFSDLPTVVYEAIRKGLYKFVSVELLGEVQAGTRVIPWVLDAVALLGADPPAVGVLKDLQQLTMARSSGLQGRARVAFSRDNTTTGGHRPTMADDKKDENVAALMARLDKLEADNKALSLKAAERESFERKLTELETQTKTEKVNAHRTNVLALFETAIKEKKILPAVRERFKRAYPVDKDDVLGIPLTDVETFIRENPNPDAPKNPATMANGDTAPVDALADTQALCAARKYVRENATDPEFRDMPRWEQLVKAGSAVFRTNPDLAKSYARLPETLASRAE